MFCALLLSLLVTNKGVIVDSYVPDLAGFTFDSMGRIASGQVPHNDFHSPIGQAFYWPFALIASVSPLRTMTVLYANALVAAVGLGFSALLLRGRLATPLFCLSLFLVLTTAISPREIMAMPWVFDHLALYNRWSWSVFAIVVFSIFLPRRMRHAEGPSAQGQFDILDGMALGVLLSVLALLKITYFAGAGALVLLALCLRTLSVRTLLAAALVFATLLAVVELRFRNLGNYVRDLGMSLEAARYEPLDRRGKLVEHLKLGAPLGFAVVLYLWIERRSNSPGRTLLFWWKELLIAAAVMITGALVATQNFARVECPLFAVALIIVLELASRRAAGSGASAPYSSRGLRRAACISLVAVAAVIPIVDTAAILIHRINSNSSQACRMRALQGTPAADLMFPPGAFSPDDRSYALGCANRDLVRLNITPGNLAGLQYSAQMIAEGTTLLKSYAKPGQSSLSLTFGNPFPLITHGRSPRGSSIWWDVGRTYSPTIFPDGKRLLGDTDWVMEPVIVPGLGGDNRGDTNTPQMMKIYGADIRREFAVVRQTGSWRLWGRKHV